MNPVESSGVDCGAAEVALSEVRHTFPKSARLHHRTLVNALFEKGRSLYVYPLRLTWRVLTPSELQASFRNVVPDGIGPVQLMVTVPKKKRRHAVDRVRMRRLLKEAFRVRRNLLSVLMEAHPEWRTLSLALVYIAEKNEDFGTVDKKMGIMLGKLSAALEKISGDKEMLG